MFQEPLRAIVVWKDGTVDACDGRTRYTKLALRKGILTGAMCYCSDGKVRRTIGFSDQRHERDVWGLIFLNPLYSGVPKFSEPERSFEIGELRAVIRMGLSSWIPAAGSATSFAQRLANAETFEALFALVKAPL